jgi:class 3 adenylate cyclase/predicted ATPase
MDFYDVLNQVITLLQREGRVTYRALKRQFNLDDDFLEDIKAEIIEAKQLAIDENDRILVWVGDTGSAPTPTPAAPEETTQQPTIQQDQPPEVEPPPEPHTPDAERRQLTVMVCDLADSTRLSGQLDPEDLRDVIRAYQETAAGVMQRYEGHIAQYLGDGLLVYFGWPQAHEDDAQRGVHAGLGILEAMQVLNARLEQEKAIRLAVRIGIHTGLVVVGEIGKGASQEHLALGETPNIASRIEGIAGRDTIAISEATYRLVQGYFVCEALGEYTLRGVDEPQRVHRVVRTSGIQSRLDVAMTRGLTPLVGRESEVTLLLERWEEAKEGQGHVVLISGEAGIGKSRLLRVVKDRVAGESYTLWECRSSPYYANTALYPVTDLLQRLLQWQPNDSPQERLEKLERGLKPYRLPLAESVPLFAALLSLPLPEAQYPPLTLAPQLQRQKTLETMSTIVLEHAERRPVLFMLEDLHWTDPSTLEWLNLLIEQIPIASVLTALTCRPEFTPPWGLRTYLTPIALNRFTRQQIETMVTRVAGGKIVPTAVMRHLVDKTDGVPLYVEEMTKAILEAGILQETDGRYELRGQLESLAIPTTLQDSLMARLDRLDTAKSVAQLGATIGRQFTYELLCAVAPMDEATLQRELGRLLEAELVYQQGIPPRAAFTFKHALIQDTAYQSLLKSTRQQVHQRLAQVLEQQFPDTATTQPELLAHHYTEAEQNEVALHYWIEAGQQAIERSADLEAIGHLTRGLEVLKRLPDTSERTQQELTLHTALGVSLRATKGFGAPEVQEVYARARELCQQVEETTQLIPVLRGLWEYYELQGELEIARELGEQLLTLAQGAREDELLMVAHNVLGDTMVWLGEFAAARDHLERGIALYHPQQYRSHAFLYGYDSGVHSLAFGSWALWYLGYPEQALRRIDAAHALAQELSHPFSRAFALAFKAWLHQLRREGQGTQEQAAVLLTLATDQGFPFWEAWGSVLHGWALAAQGQSAEGIAQLRQGIAAWRAIGGELQLPYYLALLAEAYGTAGQAEAGLRVVDEALAAVYKTGERQHEAELYRLKAGLLLMQGTPDLQEVEGCLRQAVDTARQQQAKSLELRAAVNLSRLWQHQGVQSEAHELLAPLHGWFTEGFDTTDLQDAKALLDDLS